MFRRCLTLLVTTVALLPTTAAHADPPDVAGISCSLATITDPEFPAYQVGVLDSHLVTWDDPIRSVSTDPPDLWTDPNWTVDEILSFGRISCIVRQGASNNTYASGGVVATATSAYDPTVANLTMAVAYPEPASGVPLYVCTVWTATDGHGDSVTYYADDSTKKLSTNAAASTCALAITLDLPTSLLDAIACGTVFPLVPEPVGHIARDLYGCPARQSHVRAYVNVGGPYVHVWGRT